ncbi:MAG: 4Fe-4S binding protein [Chloroflexi bacterium]|nr:4Fe-4S binding protein [Chloroflexota bacterium]
MHKESTKALYDFYKLEDKNDFFPAYLYLKYLQHFVDYVVKSLGIPTRDLPHELGDGLDEMMGAYYQQIADAGATADTSIYNAKVVKLHDAVKLFSQKENINIPISETVVPFKQAKHIIMNNPESVSIGTCACRSVSENPCLEEPMEVCLFVGDPFAAFIRDQNQMFRAGTQEEAIKILEDCHEKGFVHTAWFKKDLGSSFAMICNCCSCCCLGIRMWNLLEGTVPILASSGYVAEISEDCVGCGICVDEHACHFNAISMNEEGDKAVISYDKCMGCGVCEGVCPDGSISMKRDAAKGEPLDLDELLA